MSNFSLYIRTSCSSVLFLTLRTLLWWITFEWCFASCCRVNLNWRVWCGLCRTGYFGRSFCPCMCWHRFFRSVNSLFCLWCYWFLCGSFCVSVVSTVSGVGWSFVGVVFFLLDCFELMTFLLCLCWVCHLQGSWYFLCRHFHVLEEVLYGYCLVCCCKKGHGSS